MAKFPEAGISEEELRREVFAVFSKLELINDKLSIYDGFYNEFNRVYPDSSPELVKNVRGTKELLDPLIVDFIRTSASLANLDEIYRKYFPRGYEDFFKDKLRDFDRMIECYKKQADTLREVILFELGRHMGIMEKISEGVDKARKRTDYQ